jgi:FAD/FMN-containing dehydrogenase
MERLDRRRLLERAALLAGGAVLPGALAACSSGKRKRRGVDFDALASRLRGSVILPSSPDYRRARMLWNTRFDDVRPRAVVEVANAEDVQKVVRFARDHDLRLIARNGRHSFGGYSTAEGAVIVDVSRLTAVEVDQRAGTARLGAGLTVLPTYQALWRHKLAIPAGTCPTVGITGLTTGGGLGALSRRHGLTCDALAAAEVVDANGRLLRVSEREHADLFWALRGAGAGSFGIVTSLTFRTVPVDMPFTFLEYDFPWSSAARVLAAWQEWIHAAPRSVSTYLVIVTSPPGPNVTPAVTVEVFHAGSPPKLKPILADLVDAIGTAPTRTESSTGPFTTVPAESYCKGLRPEECQDAEVSRDGKLPLVAFYAKSNVASQPWPAAGFDTLVEWMEKRQRDPVLTPADFSPIHNVGKLLLEPCDGAINDVAPGATAFVHRDGRFVTQYQARWRTGAPRSTADANLAWTNGLYSAVARYRSGFAYQDYIDPELPDWQHAYYGSNFARLRRVKAKYDPDDFFRFARSIPPL